MKKRNQKEFYEEMVKRCNNLLHAQPEKAALHRKNLKIWEERLAGVKASKVAEEGKEKEWFDGTKNEIVEYAVSEGVLFEDETEKVLESYKRDELISYVRELLEEK